MWGGNIIEVEVDRNTYDSIHKFINKYPKWGYEDTEEFIRASLRRLAYVKVLHNAYTPEASPVQHP